MIQILTMRFIKCKRLLAHVLPGDVTDIVDVLDLSFMSEDAHGDGVLAHLRRHVLVHLKTQVPQNQVAWNTHTQFLFVVRYFTVCLLHTHTHTHTLSHKHTHTHTHTLLTSCDAVKQGEDSDCSSLLCRDCWVNLGLLLKDKQKLVLSSGSVHFYDASQNIKVFLDINSFSFGSGVLEFSRNPHFSSFLIFPIKENKHESMNHFAL